MRKFTKKQYLAAAGAAVIIAGGAGAAFAYWTTSGSGSGSATTGTSSQFTIATDAAGGGPLTPGGSSETVGVHVTNANSGHQILQSLSVAVANADGSTWTAVSGCSAADYTVTIPAVPANTDLASGGTYDTTATISMNNLSGNQDGCKDATVPLYVSAS